MNNKRTVPLPPMLITWAIAAEFVFFVPFAVMAVVIMIPGMDPAQLGYSWLFHTAGIWNFLVCSFLLSYIGPYLVICGGILLTAAIVMLNRSVDLWKRISLAIMAVVVAGFVFAPYQPAVSAAEGYEMVVPTLPALPLRGLKRAQAIGEGKPCAYEILGWKEETLLYAATCRQEENIWQFAPNAMSKPIRFEIELPDLDGESVAHTEILDFFRSDGVFPKSVEYSVRELHVRGRATFSPDGEWVAVVSRHIYGAEDVLLVREVR